jgi:cytochrome c biogenesis factor
MSTPALMRRGLSQLYVSVAELHPDGSVGVRIYYKPLVLLIWLGPVAMGPPCSWCISGWTIGTQPDRRAA